jgi:hypothetical protein
MSTMRRTVFRSDDHRCRKHLPLSPDTASWASSDRIKSHHLRGHTHKEQRPEISSSSCATRTGSMKQVGNVEILRAEYCSDGEILNRKLSSAYSGSGFSAGADHSLNLVKMNGAHFDRLTRVLVLHHHLGQVPCAMNVIRAELK